MRPEDLREHLRTRLHRLRNALSALDAAELTALREAAGETHGVAPGLFAWLEHITGWEIDRRERQSYLLRFPEEAMEPDEVPDALTALGTLALTFRKAGCSPEIDELLGAAAEVVRGDTTLQ